MVKVDSVMDQAVKSTEDISFEAGTQSRNTRLVNIPQGQ